MGGSEVSREEAEQRTRFYLVLVLRYLDCALDCVEIERSAEFAWNVRRSTEAVLLAALANGRQSEPAAHENTLEGPVQ